MRRTLLFILIFLAIATSAQDTSETSSYRGDVSRSGTYEDMPILEEPVVLWEVESGRPSRTTPVVANGLAYFGNEAGLYRAIDTETGAEIWQYQTGREGDWRSAHPVSVDGILYITSNTRGLIALSSP